LLATIEERRQERFGKDTMGSLEISPLFRGLEPYLDGASAGPQTGTPPRYPMVLMAADSLMAVDGSVGVRRARGQETSRGPQVFRKP